jgi:hypothetical protein
MDDYADENITYLEFHLIRSSGWMIMQMKILRIWSSI